MTRGAAGRALLAGALALSCTTKTTTTARSTGGEAIGTDCSKDDACGGCATCFDECRCGGGAAATCAETCAAPPDTPGDAGGPATDGGLDATLVTTLVPEAFDIGPGEEVFRCQNFQNPFGKDVAVLSTESFMTSGSHHMFVFQEPGAKDGELEPCGGLEFKDYLHTTQRSQERLTYPEGVGRWLSRDVGMRVQVHFLNASDETVHAEVAVTLRAAEPEAVPVLASQVFINTFFLSVPPRSPGSAHQTCTVPKDVSVFTAASHMHQHGVSFVARADDGQLLYETKQWAEPNPWHFTPPRKLKAGSVIDVTCNYQNDTDQPLTFGESAATNEMCIFVGGYYPAAPGESITCLF